MWSDIKGLLQIDSLALASSQMLVESRQIVVGVRRGSHGRTIVVGIQRGSHGGTVAVVQPSCIQDYVEE